MSRARELTHDRLADRFDDLMNPYDVERRLSVLVDDFLAQVELQGRRVLDAGCGTGRGALALEERGASVTAVDLGPRLVAATRRRIAGEALVGDVLRLPFADATFDVVFSSEVIEHTPDPLAAAVDMYRVLKPGGHLVLSTPVWLWQLPVRAASLLGVRPYDGLENFPKPGALRKALARAGARVVEHRGIHLLPFQLSFLHPFLRSMDRYGKTLLPLMINQCIHCTRPA